MQAMGHAARSLALRIQAGSAPGKHCRCFSIEILLRHVYTQQIAHRHHADTAKSSFLCPAEMASRSHLGCRPRPLHVSPSALTYFAGTLTPF